jgi:hypothetical protein
MVAAAAWSSVAAMVPSAGTMKFNSKLKSLGF